MNQDSRFKRKKDNKLGLKILGVIVISVVIGVGIFFLTGNKPTGGIAKSVVEAGNQVKQESEAEINGYYQPKSSPIPTWAPITAETDLYQRISELEIPTYTEDFKTFREEVNNL